MAFIPYNQNRQQLLPTDLNEIIPEDHLVRAVNDVVERLNIRSIEKKYRNGGRDAYHPRVLLKALFYGYASGDLSACVRLSACIAQAGTGREVEPGIGRQGNARCILYVVVSDAEAEFQHNSAL